MVSTTHAESFGFTVITKEVQDVLDAAAVVDGADRHVALPPEIWFLIVGHLTFRQTMELLQNVGWRSRHGLMRAARYRYGCMANRFNMLFQQMFRPWDRDGRIRFELPPDYRAYPMWSLRYYEADGAKNLTPREMRILLATVGKVQMRNPHPPSTTCNTQDREDDDDDGDDDGFRAVYDNITAEFSELPLHMLRRGPRYNTRDSGAVGGASEHERIAAAALQTMLVEFHKRWTAFFLMRRYPRWQPITHWSHVPGDRSVTYETTPGKAKNGGRGGRTGLSEFTTTVVDDGSTEKFGFTIHCPTMRLCCLYAIRMHASLPTTASGTCRDPSASDSYKDYNSIVCGMLCAPSIACSYTGSDTVSGRIIATDLKRLLRYTSSYAYPLFGEICTPSIREILDPAPDEEADA